MGHVFKNAQPDKQKYLVEYLAEHFWNLVVVANRKLTNVMETDKVLAKRVFGLLAGHPDADLKNEAEEKIKVEDPFGDDKAEPESQGDPRGRTKQTIAIPMSSSLIMMAPLLPLSTNVLLRKKPSKVGLPKEKAERDAIKKMTAKEFLADNDAVVDQAASIISAANGSVYFGRLHNAPPATLAENEKAAKDRATKERDRAVRETAREVLANNDSFESVDQATSIISAAN